ncbi:hypothetical protein L1889_12890 [Paenalcaligenes niemegkensis]|uniref:hypothetical protein n=1 Tax=Paenalcaligenes niemegkensis TaxID=2895469 RepID=UPI001EE82C74|nr:hypothetical protein [Paenalcaligenes niemegkensis]MCQ9617472.1 hypothetical protein [Paenalcaligenes niemegkensis]
MSHVFFALARAINLHDHAHQKAEQNSGDCRQQEIAEYEPQRNANNKDTPERAREQVFHTL